MRDPVVYPAVCEAVQAGLCVLPVRSDGSKAPLVAWRSYQTAAPAENLSQPWWDETTGYGLVAGAVSGGCEAWDFDDVVAYQAFLEIALAYGLAPVTDRIRQGYEDRTPGGGRRWLVQAASLPQVLGRRQVLARRPGLAQYQEPPVKVLIELPMFTVLAPSHGPTHLSGRPYVRVSGGFQTVASYLPEERVRLLDLARSLDQMPKRERLVPSRGLRASFPNTTRRPGDVYNARATWHQVLVSHGWTAILEYNDVVYWRRPGKPDGLSATTNYGGHDLLHVFTSSTAFEPDRSYTKFGAYALLAHGGDFARAALALAKMGYADDDPS